MDMKINWVRTLRTMLVAAVLVIALVGAVLASIGARGPVLNWACDHTPANHVAPPASATGPAPG